MVETPDLGSLQRQLQEHVLHGDESVRPWIAGQLDIAPDTRLRIYSDAYLLRLTEVLENDFSATLAWLGTESFAQHARAYIAAYPSSHPNVRWFGRHFAGLLREREPDQPLLAELAEFEWTKGEVFDAADRELATVEIMATLLPEVWPSLRFTLHPSVRQLRLAGNVPELWSALTSEPPQPVDPEIEAPVPWLLWRQALDVHWRSLDAGESSALQDASAGADFAKICERLHASVDDIDEQEASLRVAGMLKRWLVDGLISSIVTETA
ncbi:MAG: DNA-binding domain-containing protein [Rhodanobacteraceae bacterium]